jgi:hypothetical protein
MTRVSICRDLHRRIRASVLTATSPTRRSVQYGQRFVVTIPDAVSEGMADFRSLEQYLIRVMM